MRRTAKVVVGVSGGVDSAVAALRLVQAGFDVHGLHMTNWDEADTYCTAAADYQSASRVCRELGIPLHRANFAAEYREHVFADFLRQYRAGRTPNPDVLCNRHIKFGSFLNHARRLGADRIATGHYARLDPGTPTRLLRAADAAKDQTYFLHAVPFSALSLTLFPLGDLRKTDVRRLANEAGLPNHDRRDSTGICFIGEQPFGRFLGRYIEPAPGPIVATDGRELGRHEGLHFYTLGQRTGLGIGGRRGSNGTPWYVAGKVAASRTLVVTQGRNDPRLWGRVLRTAAPTWLGDAPAAIDSPTGWHCHARLRHRHEPAECVVRTAGDGLVVEFTEAQWAIAPGQFAVFYDDEACCGGGEIEEQLPSVDHQVRVA